MALYLWTTAHGCLSQHPFPSPSLSELSPLLKFCSQPSCVPTCRNGNTHLDISWCSEALWPCPICQPLFTPLLSLLPFFPFLPLSPFWIAPTSIGAGPLCHQACLHRLQRCKQRNSAGNLCHRSWHAHSQSQWSNWLSVVMHGHLEESASSALLLFHWVGNSLL